MRRLVVRSRTLIRCLIPRLTVRHHIRYWNRTQLSLCSYQTSFVFSKPSSCPDLLQLLMLWIIHKGKVTGYFDFLYIHILYSHTYFALHFVTFEWRHNGRDGVSNHRRLVVCLTVYSGADHRKHQSSASLAFVRGIHRWPTNSPHKGPVTRKNVSIWWHHHDILAHHIVLRYVCQVIKIYHKIY